MLWLDLDSWNDVLIISLALAALAAIVVGTATFAVIRLQRIEEIATKTEFERYKLESGERISNAETRSAEANERAAVADQKAAEAALALELFRTPRVLTDEQLRRIVEKVSPFRGQPFSMGVFNDAECIDLMVQISKSLVLAGWEHKAWEGGGDTVLTLGVMPPLGLTGVVGVYVQTDISRISDFGPALDIMAVALSAEGIPAKPEIGPMRPNTNTGTIQILVGRKK